MGAVREEAPSSARRARSLHGERTRGWNDADSDGTGKGTRMSREETEAGASSRELEEREMRDLLTESWWGVLATASGGQPYAVPVVYGYDGRRIWVVSREGRKTRNLRENPAVCLTVTRVADGGSSWASVLVLGRARLGNGLAEKLAALRALRRQCGSREPVSPADAAGMATARVIRIDPEEVTGRAVARPTRGSDGTE